MGKVLLIVDDNKPYRKMLISMLERAGLFTTFYEAGDTFEAKACLESERRVDLVVLDLIMPRRGGLELIRWARGVERHRELPIMVLSVEGGGDMKARCLKAGASDYMVKPFDPVELTARMGLLMRRRETQEELKKRNRELLKINEELRQYAVFDELTRLYTRPYFIEDVAKEMKRCERYKVPMSVMLVDLDGFDELTGTFGRATGDEILRDVADMLRGSVRESDSVGRYGPEQFILKLANTGIDGAVVPAERIRASIEEKLFTCGGRPCRATASIGVADYPANAPEGTDRLLGRVGHALDEAKSAGRNRVAASRD
jgi:two-component system cell cycle response regulator